LPLWCKKNSKNKIQNRIKKSKINIKNQKPKQTYSKQSETNINQFPVLFLDAHYDGEANFNDKWAFDFGGWSKPAIKQYDDHGAGCGCDADVSWYP